VSALRACAAAATVTAFVLAAGCAPLPQPGGVPVPGQVPPPASSPPSTGPSPAPAPAPAPPFRLDAEPAIEVGLAWDADSLAFTAIKPQLTWRIGRAHDRATGRVRGLVVRVAGGAAELRADGAAAPIARLAAGDTLWLGEPQDAPFPVDAQLGWQGKSWRGQGKAFVNARGRLTFALRLPLETYLVGVVPGEIGALSDALIEAGRAQAVAARSYTMFYRGRRGAEGFDVYGTVEDQVYGPIEGERPLATRVVDATRGRFALWQGGPIRANYYSTCGGITADVWEAFPAAGLPYIASVRDRGAAGPDWCAKSPIYRWREEWDAAAFLETVRRFGAPEGVVLPARATELRDVRVASRSRSGRVWRLEVETDAGAVTVPAWSLRRVLRRPGEAHAILRSNLFKIDVRRDRATGRAVAVVVSGAGSGHGAGLCQTGALGMAQGGRTADQILAHYYPGIELRKLY